LSWRNLSLCVQHYGDEISAGKGTCYPNPNHNNDNCMKLMGFSEISLSLTFILPITAANSWSDSTYCPAIIMHNNNLTKIATENVHYTKW